jgi:hypothetical protein
MNNVARYLIVIFMISSMNALAQFDFNYYPPKPDALTETEYRKGKLILENSYNQIKSSKNGLVGHDYINFATAYNLMGQPADTIYALLTKALKLDPQSFCRIIEHIHTTKGGIENYSLYQKIGKPYKDLIESCSKYNSNQNGVTPFDPLSYAIDNNYDTALVLKIDRISNRDQKFRATNYNAVLQTPLDKQNMQEIRKIIEKYGYPGKSLVGEEYDYVACAIIQRSNRMDYWEAYLSLISEATRNGELSDVNHLKMLLDRVYVDKTGTQIFGSKMNVPFANDETIMTVKRKYKIDVEH